MISYGVKHKGKHRVKFSYKVKQMSGSVLDYPVSSGILEFCVLFLYDKNGYWRAFSCINFGRDAVLLV